ncbi:MAG TPA: class I SAM-dependent methyltransferase [Thermoanaerobaculia bacterium]|nr:class I SAM-dependent methyltransferase [Thermoanaerobaculia bacterium]
MSADDRTYDDACAEVYDQWFGACEEAAIDRLAELAGSGRVLELGIGSGLLALPLAARGIDLHGIDLSPAMVAKLRAKPGGDAIPVTMGSFAEVAVEGEHSLIFVAYNTFFALQTQDEQVRCFENVAAHLAPGGAFVLEAFVPQSANFTGGLKVTAVTDERIGLKVSEHDPVRQRLKSQHVVIRNGEIRLYPVEVRYAWPAELDLMARLAGLRLRHRWSDWNRAEIGPNSARHISVYEKTGS